MVKICEICNKKFESNSSTRIYCYDCSGDSTRSKNETRKHQKTVLRRSMKLQAILGFGNTMSWKEYKSEAMKCVLVCSNCHKEIHFKLGYK